MEQNRHWRVMDGTYEDGKAYKVVGTHNDPRFVLVYGDRHLAAKIADLLNWAGDE